MKQLLVERPSREGRRSFAKKSAENARNTTLSLDRDSSVPARDEKNNNLANHDLANQALQLSSKARRELLDRLALSLQDEKASDRDVSLWSSSVAKALARRLGGTSGTSAGPLLIKRIVGASAAFAPIESFINQSGLGRMSVLERAASLDLLAEMLLEHAQYVARKSGAPLGPKLIASCQSNIAAVFDQSFPDYLQCGMSHVVFRQLVRPQA